jgi:prepilin-type processing-associated H-X9-DG protein
MIRVKVALWYARGRASEVICQATLAQIGKAMMLYAKEHDGKLPDCSKWCDELSDMYGLSTSLFICREAGAIRPGSRPAEPLVTDYGFNENLSGIKVSQVREAGKTVLLFEAERGQNVHGGPNRMISAPRHPDGFNFVFVDGHAETVPKGELDRLRWTPQ